MTLGRGLTPVMAALLLAACGGLRAPAPGIAASSNDPPSAAQAPASATIVASPPAPPPAAPPAWVSKPVTPDAVDVPTSIYVVQPGDTVRSIANKTGAGSEAIARANSLAKPFRINPGQKLRIPGGRYHLVQSGQSGIAIARAYGVDWSQIIALNGLQDPYILRAGMRILVPSRSQVAAMSVEQRASAFRLDLDDLITGSEPALAVNQQPVKPSSTPTRALPSTAVVAEPATFSGRFDWPIDGRLISKFGARGGGVISQGVDIAAPVGTAIKAAADGTVAYVGSDIPSLGRLVLIRHGDGWITAYAHADELLVTRGQAVKRGQVIARCGDSGRVEEPLLHFEMRQARSAVDPIKYLPPRG